MIRRACIAALAIVALVGCCAPADASRQPHRLTKQANPGGKVILVKLPCGKGYYNPNGWWTIAQDVKTCVGGNGPNAVTSVDAVIDLDSAMCSADDFLDKYSSSGQSDPHWSQLAREYAASQIRAQLISLGCMP